MNRFPESQHTFQKKCTVPGEKTCKEAATEKANTTYINNVAILGDSIINFFRGIKSSKDLLHYIDPTLEEQNFEAAIIHIGINDTLTI